MGEIGREGREGGKEGREGGKTLMHQTAVKECML